MIDVGCGPGFPITAVLVAEGLNVFAVDAAPSFVEAFRRNFPNTPVVCEAVVGWQQLRFTGVEAEELRAVAQHLRNGIAGTNGKR